MEDCEKFKTNQQRYHKETKHKIFGLENKLVTPSDLIANNENLVSDGKKGNKKGPHTVLLSVSLFKYFDR